MSKDDLFILQLSIDSDADTSLPPEPDYLTGSEFNSDYSVVGSTLSLVSNSKNKNLQENIEKEKDNFTRLPQVQEKTTVIRFTFICMGYVRGWILQ